MVKKMVLAAVLCGSFFCARADEQEDLQMLLKQVDFVLFILERNTVRMERYGLHELNDDVNYLSKDLSKQHCQFKLSLAGKDFRAHSIAWDDEQIGRLKITSGKRREPSMYYLLLSKIFPAHIAVQELPIICFDCVVNHVAANKREDIACKPRTKAKSKSLVDVIVPFGEGHLSTQLILDGTVRAVCGFFVQHDVFEQDLALSGKVKKEQAFSKGVLVEVPAEKKADQFDAQEIKAVLEQQAEQKESFLGKCKASLLATFLAMKHVVSCSWAKMLACFGR